MTGPALACQREHPQIPENVYERPDGSRICRRCATESQRKGRAAKRAPLPVLRPPAWMDEALCAQADPDAWFPENGPAVAARRICEACPVRSQCLEHAIAANEAHGIWGGLNTEERRVVARRRRLAGAA